MFYLKNVHSGGSFYPLMFPRELDDFYYYDRIQHLFSVLIRGKWRRYIFDSIKSKF